MDQVKIPEYNALFAEMFATSTVTPWICADNRERAVLEWREQLDTVPLITKQMTVGDYTICKGDTILAVIERKTYNDYGASLKDGRHNNKDKMIKLREETGCAVIYLVEGRQNIKQTDLCNGIPFSTIEASMMRLAVRDKISVFRTVNELDTAQWLVRFCKSMNGVDVVDSPDVRGGIQIIGGVPEVIDVVTAPRAKTDIEILYSMWACFRGITVETAPEYVKRWSLADIILKRAPIEGPASYTEVKIFGKKVTKPTQAQLKDVPVAVQEKMLACVPGVSIATAREILAEYDLSVVLEIGLDEIKNFKIGKSRRCLGVEVSKRILKFFNDSEKKV